MSECKFCDMYEKKAQDVLYVFDSFFVALDSCPMVEGHMLFVPKRHVASFSDLSLGELSEFQGLQRRVLDMFPEFDFVSRYRHFIDNAGEGDGKLIDRCRGAIDFFESCYDKGECLSHFSVLWNEGKMSGQEYEHLHIQMTPAYKNRQNKRGMRGLLNPNRKRL